LAGDVSILEKLLECRAIEESLCLFVIMLGEQLKGDLVEFGPLSGD
jgi:hypothetical protein